MKNLSRTQVERLGAHGANRNGNVAKCLSDFLVVTNPYDKSVTPCLLRDGYWESWITSWFTYHVLPGSIFLDIGANCGYYTFLASKLVGETGSVIAFEPNPEYTQLLRAGVSLNRASNVKVMPVALGAEFGLANLHIPGAFHGSAAIGQDFSGRYIEKIFTVDVHTLDGYIQYVGDGPVVIKMDVEGYEEQVLDGASNFLYDRDDVTIVMEYTAGAYSPDFYDKLLDIGNVTVLNYDGGESGALRKRIETPGSDWTTLIVRKK